MADNADNTEPARAPAQIVIPPFQAIIDEGTQEIKRQANDLVERTLVSKTAIDPKILRKWGDDGARYFFRRLKARVSEQVAAAAVTRTVRSVTKATSPSRRHPLLAKVAAVIAVARPKKTFVKVAKSKTAAAPVVAVKNWNAQQRHRLSYVAAAVMRGLLVALIMTIGAIILLRLMA